MNHIHESSSMNRQQTMNEEHSALIGYHETISDELSSGWVAHRNGADKAVTLLLLRGNIINSVSRNELPRADVRDAVGCPENCGFQLRHNYLGDEAHELPEIYAISDDYLDEFMDWFYDEIQNSLEVKIDDERKLKLASDGRLIKLPFSHHLSQRVTSLEAEQRGSNPCQLVYIEISDLIKFLTHHNIISGIQRVMCNLIQFVGDEEKCSSKLFRLCTIAGRDGLVEIYKVSDIINLIAFVTQSVQPLDAISRRMSDIGCRTILDCPRRGDVMLIVGAYWVTQDISAIMARYKRNNVILGAHIFDLIPITNPELTTTETAEEIQSNAFGVFLLADFFITISEFVKDELIRLLGSEIEDKTEVSAVLLPHNLQETSIAEGADRSAPQSFTFLDRPYVLCVGTVECRKNHVLLHKVWSYLARKCPPEETPYLVIVGRWGWKIDDYKQFSERSNLLGGLIIHLTSVDDGQLNRLYDQCLFTVFPSISEGWGVPVGESLYHGKLCVASSTSSIPEVGGDFVDYFDPHDYFDACRAIERPIFDRKYLLSRNRAIKENFLVRSRSEHALNFFETLEREVVLPQVSGTTKFSIHLRSNQAHNLRGLNDIYTKSWRERASQFVFNDGWSRPCDDGIFLTRSNARIHFNTEFPSGTEVDIWMRFYYTGCRPIPRFATSNDRRNFSYLDTNMLEKTTKLFSHRGVVDEDGDVIFYIYRSFELDFADNNSPSRLCLSALYYCAASGADIRKILEEFAS